MLSATIDVFNQSLMVTTTHPAVHQYLHEYANRMMRYRMEVKIIKGQSGIRKVTNWVPDGQYAVTMYRGMYYCFHRNQLDDLIAYLHSRGLTQDNITTRVTPDYCPAPATLAMKPVWSDRDYQVPAINYIVSPGVLKILEVQTGQGKAHPLDVALRTPTGSILMGDVKVGSPLIGSNGEAITVTGVYPQGVETVYQLCFADGRTERASGGHLWKVQIDCGAWVVRNTLTLIDLLKSGANLAIPLPDPLVQFTCELPDFTVDFTVLTAYLDGDVDQRQSAIDYLNQHCRDDDIITVPAECCRATQRLYRSMGYHATALSSTEIHVYKPTDGTLCITRIDIQDDTETQCISVSAPDSLYVTDNYVVTHNTYMALKAASLLGQRIQIVTRGGYLEKWVADVEKTYDIDPSRVIVIRSTIGLSKALLAAAEGDFDYDIVMVSIGAVAGYIKLYEDLLISGMEKDYVDPRLMGMVFQIGLRIIDEGHQMLHAYYRYDLYSHYVKGVVLSATLKANDEAEQKVYDIIYPESARYDGGKYNRYIEYTTLFYAFSNPKAVRCLDREGRYSHTSFEYWLMYAKGLRGKYLAMIARNVGSFLRTRKPGQRMLVFMATVDMCNFVCRELKRWYPNITVGRYTADDSLNAVIDDDVIVTTPGSGGTAIDIPDLAWVLSTVSTRSYKRNIQMLGRLRQLVNYPGERPKYYHMVSTSVPKHMEYYRLHLEDFKPKVHSMSTDSIENPI